MGTGYTRNDTSNNIDNGNVINASDHDGEFDAIVAAFNASTGHTHDGTSAEGGPISKIGPAQDLVVSGTEILPKTTNTLDFGNATYKLKDAYFAGNIDVDGTLTVDGAVTIAGATVALSGNPTVSGNLTLSGNIDVGGTFDVTGATTLDSTLDVAGEATFTGNVIVPNSTTGTHALNTTTADGRYLQPSDIVGMLLQETKTFTSSTASPEFTTGFTASDKKIVLEVFNVSQVTGTYDHWILYVSTDNGSTYTGLRVNYTQFEDDYGTTAYQHDVNTDSRFELVTNSPNRANIDVFSGIFGTITITQNPSHTEATAIEWDLKYQDNTGYSSSHYVREAKGRGFIDCGGDNIDGLKLQFENAAGSASGNIEFGIIRLLTSTT